MCVCVCVCVCVRVCVLVRWVLVLLHRVLSSRAVVRVVGRCPHIRIIAAIGMHLGDRHEAISKLTELEAMLLARVHPLIQVMTVHPSGQHVYRGHVCNLEQRSVEWMSSLPASPDKVPVVWIRRRTREAAGKRHKRAPIRANRWRMEAALDVLEQVHADYNGSWCPKPDRSNLDRHCGNPDAEGYVELQCNEREIAGQVGMSMDLDLFARWLSNATFEVAALLQAWLGEAKIQDPSAEDWDLSRRRFQEIYQAEDGSGAAAHARGANTINTSWLARLLREETTCPDFDGDDGEAVLCDELLAVAEQDVFAGPLEDAGQKPRAGQDDRTEEEWKEDFCKELKAAAGALEVAEGLGRDVAAGVPERGVIVDPPGTGEPLQENQRGLVTGAFIKANDDQREDRVLLCCLSMVQAVSSCA